jgi:hypothetical protein
MPDEQSLALELTQAQWLSVENGSLIAALSSG